MNLWISKKEMQILETKKEIENKKYEFLDNATLMSQGISEEQLNKLTKRAQEPLLSELDRLTLERQFERDCKLLTLNIVTIAVALLVAFLVPK